MTVYSFYCHSIFDLSGVALSHTIVSTSPIVGLDFRQTGARHKGETPLCTRATT